MPRLSLPCALLLLLLCAFQVHAQLPGPDLPKLSNLTFGWVSMSGSDPNLNMFTSFAPNMLFIKDFGYTSGGETAVGASVFSDFQVDANFNSAITSIGPGLFRVSHFGFVSNNAQLANFMPGTLTKTSGEAIELAYAQRVGNVALGVSFVPMDSTKFQLTSGGIVMQGDSDTDYGIRIGGSVNLTETVKFGANYSYQEDEASMTVPLPSLPEPLVQEGDYITRSGTVGLTWQATPSALVYTSSKQINAVGTNLDRIATVYNAGVQYQVTKRFAVRSGYADGGASLCLSWISPCGLINAAYTHKALQNAKEFLGDGDAFFAGLALAF